MGPDLRFLANDTEAGQWSPDGTKIAIFGGFLNFDTGDYTDLGPAVRSLSRLGPLLRRLVAGWVETRLRGVRATDGSLNGVYSIRSSDGGDCNGSLRLSSTTVSPDYAPNGKRLLVSSGPLSVVQSNGNGPHQITPKACSWTSAAGAGPTGERDPVLRPCSRIRTGARSGSSTRTGPGCGGSLSPVAAVPLRPDLHRLPEAGLVSGRTEDHVRRHFLIPNDHFDLYTVNADGTASSRSRIRPISTRAEATGARTRSRRSS